MSLKNIWKNNKNWIIWSFVLIITLALSSSIQDKLPIKISIYLGLFFLTLTLVPVNIHKLLGEKFKKWNSKIITYRRDFGILSGIFIVLHAILAINIIGKQNPEFSFRYDTITGFIAYWIFIVLLLTSSNFSVRLLKKNWKLLHLLVWVAVGLSLIHVFLAKYNFDYQEFPFLALVFFGLIILASVVAAFRKKFLKLGLFLVGLFLAIAIVLSINSTAFSDLKYFQKEETKTTSQQISVAELNTHNSSFNCWISFDKKVYNVTNYLKKHPGGEQSLLKFCGKSVDSSSQMHPGGSFDSQQIQDILKEYLVASLN